jgi:carboxypeptidase Taq
MPSVDAVKNKFNNLVRDLENLKKTSALLVWDQSVNLPEKAVKHRAAQIATLENMIHEKFVSLEKNRSSLNNIELMLLNKVKKDFSRAQKISSSLKMRLSENSCQCYQKWIEARENNNFSLVRDALKTNLDLRLEYSSLFDNVKHPADPLIDISEPSMKSSRISNIFDCLKKSLIPLIKDVHASNTDRGINLAESLLAGYDVKKQWDFNMKVLNYLGFDPARTCVNNCIHAFTQGFCVNDVRITTQMDPQNIISGLSSTIHEAGHAFYELGFNPLFDATPLADASSVGLHESQSRFWENQIGKSREFWEFLFPKLVDIFPQRLNKNNFEEFFRLLNFSMPSLIRTEADELTYDIHVIIRFELELMLLDGSIGIDDLPEIWNERYYSDLGVRPQNLKQGVLQDVHWFSDGIGGAFQCYTLGNIMSAQIADALKKEIPDFNGNLKKGSFKDIHKWLNENIHYYGSSLTTEEIIKKSCKAEIDASFYIEYLKNKYDCNKL